MKLWPQKCMITAKANTVWITPLLINDENLRDILADLQIITIITETASGCV